MNRRGFFKLLGMGAAAVPLVRTWPFRVYSFPQTFDEVSRLSDLGRGSGSVWTIGPNREPRMIRTARLHSQGCVFKVTEVNQDEKSITLASIISPDTPADRLHSSLECSVDGVYSTVSRLGDSGERADDLIDRWSSIRLGRRDDDRHI